MAAGTSPQGLVIDERDSVRWLTLDRPARKNALDLPLLHALTTQVERASRDPDCRVLVLAGSGGAFCAGADLELLSRAGSHDLESRLDDFHRLIHAVAGCPVPVVAAVDGPAVGFGADLALSCDLRVLSSRGYIDHGFVRLGLMPDGGGTHTLTRLVGRSRAFELMTLPERLDAASCERLGLANHVVAPEELQEFTGALAARLAAAAPLAVRNIKQALRQGERDALERALARERQGQLELLRSADFQEGVAAFTEKRAPRFRGS
ncbi:MAG TPA: enoyl-CoA hydratase-related protein [Polyangiaceae bacterium]|nr:enoyl-CoA hydratase-related protein [Polyangiaceae bacterium]